jgi:hypothetical protein
VEPINDQERRVTQDDLIQRVAVATTELKLTRDARDTAEAKHEAAREALSTAWGALRDHQDRQVEAALLTMVEGGASIR